MKKAITLITVLVMMFSSTVASASYDEELWDNNLYAPTLATMYLMWGELFGATNIDDQYDIRIDDEKHAKLYMDTLCITADADTRSFIEGYLIVKYPGYTDTEMDLRALALFAAVEYGHLVEETSAEIRMVRSDAIEILNKYKQATIDYSDAIAAGQIVPFYIGNQVIYSIFRSSNGTQAILFE